MDTAQEVRDLSERWAEAERTSDAQALAGLATSDLTLIGPVGFVLERTAWLDRFGAHGLQMESLDWQVDSIRVHGDSAVVLGRQTQRASFAGQRADGQFRVGIVAVRGATGWLLAAIQYSMLGGPGPFARESEGAR